MAADGHKDDGSETVRRLRKLRFVRPVEPNEFPPEQRDVPVFVGSPVDEPQAEVSTAPIVAGFVSTLAEICGGWRERLSQRIAGLSFSFYRLDDEDTELIARVALIFVLLPLAFAVSPNRSPRTAKIEPINFILEDRLSFAEGLRQRLASQTVSFRPELEAMSAVKSEAVKTEVPSFTDEDTAAPSPMADPKTAGKVTVELTSSELPAMVMDQRRWSLPFDSQEYAIADLPASPQASFKTEVDVSSFPEEFRSIAPQNDEPVVVPLAQTKRPAERRKSRVLAYSRRAPQVNRAAPVVVETVVVEQEKPAFPPLLFFLGAPPPPEAPAQQETAQPKSQSWIPDSLQDIFKNQD